MYRAQPRRSHRRVLQPITHQSIYSSKSRHRSRVSIALWLATSSNCTGYPYKPREGSSDSSHQTLDHTISPLSGSSSGSLCSVCFSLRSAAALQNKKGSSDLLTVPPIYNPWNRLAAPRSFLRLHTIQAGTGVKPCHQNRTARRESQPLATKNLLHHNTLTASGRFPYSVASHTRTARKTGCFHPAQLQYCNLPTHP
jgi:hypothetical protein